MYFVNLCLSVKLIKNDLRFLPFLEAIFADWRENKIASHESERSYDDVTFHLLKVIGRVPCGVPVKLISGFGRDVLLLRVGSFVVVGHF